MSICILTTHSANCVLQRLLFSAYLPFATNIETFDLYRALGLSLLSAVSLYKNVNLLRRMNFPLLPVPTASMSSEYFECTHPSCSLPMYLGCPCDEKKKLLVHNKNKYSENETHSTSHHLQNSIMFLFTYSCFVWTHLYFVVFHKEFQEKSTNI